MITTQTPPNNILSDFTSNDSTSLGGGEQSDNDFTSEPVARGERQVRFQLTFPTKTHWMTELLWFLIPLSWIRSLWSALWGSSVPEQTQREARALISELDQSNLDEERQWLGTEYEEMSAVRRGRTRYSYISELVKECKQVLPGINVDTRSNRLVAQRWLERRMRDKDGFRPSQIQSCIWLAMESIFVPDRYEVEARQFAATHAFMNRVAEGNTHYFSRGRPWLFNWFGAVRRPAPIGDR